MESLVQDGDELIVFRGVDEQELGVYFQLWSWIWRGFNLFPLVQIETMKSCVKKLASSYAKSSDLTPNTIPTATYVHSIIPHKASIDPQPTSRSPSSWNS